MVMAFCQRAVDIPLQRSILKLSLDQMHRSGRQSNNATGGNMVGSPPQYEMIA